MKTFARKTHKLDLKWLKSYFIVVLAVSVVLFSYSLIVISQLRKDADSNNRQIVDYYYTATEKSLKSLQDFSSTLLYSEKAKKIHDYPDEEIFSPESLSIAYDLIYDIRNFILVNSMVDDIYIYYPKVDCIIGKRGCYSSYAYFKTGNISSLPMDEEYYRWMNMLFSDNTIGFHPCLDGNGQNFVVFSQEATFSDGERRIVVAKISQAQLSKFIGEMSFPCAFVGLVDKNGVIFASDGDQLAFVDENGRYVSTETTNQYIVYRADSETWPLQLVTVLDFRAAYKIVKLTTIILIIGFVATMVVGLSISTVFAAKNKRELVQIKNRFSSPEDPASKDDYEYICTEIDKLLQANVNAVAATVQQQKMIEAMFLKELFQKRNDTDKAVDHLCGLYNINFENALFSLVTAQNFNASTEQIQRILEQSQNPDFIVFRTRLENTEVFLCNFEERTKNVQAPVLEFARKIREAGQCEVNVSSLILASTDISAAWRDMCQQGSTGVLLSDPAAESGPSLTMLGEFQIAIEQDCLSDAVALLPELCKKMEQSKSANLTLCRKHALLCQLYENYDNEQIIKKLDQLVQIRDKKDWEKKLTELLRSLDRDLNKKPDTRQVADMAQELIHREYRNPQLGLQMIAERIGVSQSYLSRLFKSKFGMSVIQYLNYWRVEQAKILMLQGSDNLKVIAVQVGFSSDVNLIRVFKTFENITPGLFRSEKMNAE